LLFSSLDVFAQLVRLSDFRMRRVRRITLFAGVVFRSETKNPLPVVGSGWMDQIA